MKNKKTLRISPEQKQGITKSGASKIIADAITCPTMAALRVVVAADGQMTGDALNYPDLQETLHAQSLAVNQGDLSQAEAMLMNQAVALQSIFARLAERAMGNDAIQPFEANMKMALRAQSQCRATLKTLASIKKPPVIYVRQANIAHRHLQVNNGILASTAQHTPHEQTEKTNSTNKLLEAPDGKRLDTRAKSTAINTDRAMETVEQVNCTKDRRGKTHIAA